VFRADGRQSSQNLRLEVLAPTASVIDIGYFSAPLVFM